MPNCIAAAENEHNFNTTDVLKTNASFRAEELVATKKGTEHVIVPCFALVRMHESTLFTICERVTNCVKCGHACVGHGNHGNADPKVGHSRNTIGKDCSKAGALPDGTNGKSKYRNVEDRKLCPHLIEPCPDHLYDPSKAIPNPGGGS